MTREVLRRGWGEESLPVSADQAIRIFAYLRTICPSIGVLSISAREEFRGSGIRSWEANALGERTILTIRGNSNYEHIQEWVGQKRITTTTKRYSYSRPYLVQTECWKLSPGLLQLGKILVISKPQLLVAIEAVFTIPALFSTEPRNPSTLEILFRSVMLEGSGQKG